MRCGLLLERVRRQWVCFRILGMFQKYFHSGHVRGGQTVLSTVVFFS